MKKFLLTLLIALLPIAVVANDNESDNKSGISMGSAGPDGDIADSAWMTWNNVAYLDVFPYNQVQFQLKHIAKACDTLIYEFHTSNNGDWPDSLGWYELVYADTVISADSLVVTGFPHGTGKTLSTLGRYIKILVIMIDGTADTATTATIGEAHMFRNF